MKIITYQSYNSFYGLVPLSEYNGTILKLTNKDKECIAELQQKINDYNSDLYEILRYKKFKKTWTEKNQNIYLNRKFDLMEKIEDARQKIQQIKKDRLEKQKNKDLKLSISV